MFCRNLSFVCIILSDIQAFTEGHARVGSTLEMDIGHKSKKIGLYLKSLRPFSRILCVADDPHTYMQQELLVRSQIFDL